MVSVSNTSGGARPETLTTRRDPRRFALTALLRRLYFGAIEMIPVTKAAPVLVIALLFGFVGLALMLREWRRAASRQIKKRECEPLSTTRRVLQMELQIGRS